MSNLQDFPLNVSDLCNDALLFGSFIQGFNPGSPPTHQGFNGNREEGNRFDPLSSNPIKSDSFEAAEDNDVDLQDQTNGQVDALDFLKNQMKNAENLVEDKTNQNGLFRQASDSAHFVQGFENQPTETGISREGELASLYPTQSNNNQARGLLRDPTEAISSLKLISSGNSTQGVSTSQRTLASTNSSNKNSRRKKMKPNDKRRPGHDFQQFDEIIKKINNNTVSGVSIKEIVSAQQETQNSSNQASTNDSERQGGLSPSDSLYSGLGGMNPLPNSQDVQENNVAIVDEEAVKDLKKSRTQSRFRNAYPTIILYVFKILRSIIFSTASEFPEKEDSFEWMIKVGLYSQIEIFEKKNLENEKNDERKGKQKKASSSLSFEYFLQSGKESGKNDALESLDNDQLQFMDDQGSFFRNLRRIRDEYEFNTSYSDTYMTAYIDDANLTNVKVWSKLKNEDNKNIEEERAGVIMVILVAMILKFIPLEGDILTYKDRKPTTVSFLNFLFKTGIEPFRRFLLREKDFRKHIHEKFEELFEDLLKKIKEKLKFGDENQSQVQKDRCQMLNQVLESINKNRGLSWENEKKDKKDKKPRKRADKELKKTRE